MSLTCNLPTVGRLIQSQAGLSRQQAEQNLRLSQVVQSVNRLAMGPAVEVTASHCGSDQWCGSLLCGGGNLGLQRIHWMDK